jgi:TonB-dependent SusC/RagA subfamily outer membrane receptor
MSPEKLISAIQAQSGYNLFYTSGLLEEGKKTDVIFDKSSLSDALETATTNQPYKYDLIGKTIVLKPRLILKGKKGTSITNAEDKEESGASNGYQKINKKLNTGSYGEVSRKEIESKPTSNIYELLSNMAGVVIQGTKITIRGASSLMASTDPLIILDGSTFAIADLNSIDPNSIQNITVLKDGSETALYGSRGANGVIIITTRTGGKSFINNDDFGTINFNKDGSIQFDKTHITLIMKALNQIYQIDYAFESRSPEGFYSGHLSKDITRDDMIQILISAGVILKEKGNEIIIIG